jgi:O-antigen ligase
MALKHILSFLTLFLFIAIFYKSKNKSKAYVSFILYAFPLMDLHLTNEPMGMFTVYDGVSLFALLYFFKDFITTLRVTSIYFLLFCVLSIVLFIGCFKSEFVYYAFISAIKSVSIFIYAKVLIDVCRNEPPFVNQVIKYLKMICLVSVIFTAIQLSIGLTFTFYPSLNPNTVDHGNIRYPGFFYDVQVHAQYLAMCSFLFLTKSDNQSIKITMVNYGLFFCLVILGLFLTGGRAGLTGLATGMLVLFLSGTNKFRLSIVGAAVVGYLIISSLPQYFVVFNRDEGVNDSFEIRSRIWTESIQVFKANPIFGIGSDSYNKYNMKHTDTGYYLDDEEIVLYGTESGYLKILVECGALAFLVILGFIFLPVINAIVLYAKKAINRNVFFIIAAMFAWITSFLTSNTIDDKRIVILLATLLCLLISFQPLTRKHNLQSV